MLSSCKGKVFLVRAWPVKGCQECYYCTNYVIDNAGVFELQNVRRTTHNEPFSVVTGCKQIGIVALFLMPIIVTSVVEPSWWNLPEPKDDDNAK